MIRRFWIVGASSGIGLALAQHLLNQGHAVTLSARRAAALQTLAEQFPQRAFVVVCDVRDLASVNAAVQKIEQHWGALDTVIYNAGICEYVDGGLISEAIFAKVLDTNLLGLARVCECALPLLKKGQQPQLAGVSSSAAYLPLPRAEYYGSSKAAMSYFLHTLRIAWKSYGIRVQVISPGFVETPLTNKNDFEMPCRISAMQAARTIEKGLATSKLDIHFPRRFTTILKFLGALPLSWQQKLTGRLINK
jgi:NAD(P)-dependent dehydrogenase (short-subunit alcohol dehydrogenase family)